MSAIIQAVVLHCPTALVWNHAGEGKMSSHLVGSPLDQLPLPPSALPMAPRFSNDHVRIFICLSTQTFLVVHFYFFLGGGGVFSCSVFFLFFFFVIFFSFFFFLVNFSFCKTTRSAKCCEIPKIL